MKGQVFTVAKLHYINGVVFKAAESRSTTIETLAGSYPETTKSGNAKHPEKRVRDLVRLAAGVGLLTLDKHKVDITELGQRYYHARSPLKWGLSDKQRVILQQYILEDPYRTETIYAITTLLFLTKAGYKGDKLSRQYAIEIGKAAAWKSDVTYAGFTKFGLSYIEELGLMQVSESDLMAGGPSAEERYQEKVNTVNLIVLPEGQLPAPMPATIGRRVRYPSNPRISKTALVAADFKCELDSKHITFRNCASNNQYMEAHHLVPMSKQGLFDVRLDVPENILSLCPTCHRKIHLADDAERKATVEKAFRLKAKGLPTRGIHIDFKRLCQLYSFPT
ncbi:hypothetical protein GEOBRER4_n1602 [Citrifermentans bremense]|uniref:HNH domain-containing protein n=1 Tax=Citrifermentans bremense TaxID=60035 RepID=A0A6S6LZP1_9BACT|nr:HNH endonuclease signature motif containing protein [Citrifermentans bremense]BCG46789.1 hypothetical protein GEOBRER4_n1602 [Citrifermentans bremense]